MFVWCRQPVQWHGRGGKFPTVWWIVAHYLMASSVIWMSVIKQPLTAVEMRLWRQLDCEIWRDVCVLVNVAGRLGDWSLDVSGFKLDVKTEKWRRSWWMEFDWTNKMWCEIGYESVLLNVPEHTNSVDLSTSETHVVRWTGWQILTVSSCVFTHHCQQRTTSCSKA